MFWGRGCLLSQHPWALKDVFWGLLCLSGAFQSRAEDAPSHSHTTLPSRRQVVPERGPAHVCLPRAGHTGRLGGGVHVSHGIHRAVLPVLCTWIQEGDPIRRPLRQLRALHLQPARGLSPPHRCAPPGPSTHLSLHAQVTNPCLCCSEGNWKPLVRLWFPKFAN